MTSDIAIRPIESIDLDAVVEIAAALRDAPHWPKSSYAQALDPTGQPPRICLVAAGANGQIAGFVVASLVAPEAELESIAVAIQFQRQGVARALLVNLLRELCLRGIAKLFLEVRQSNRAAQALYRSVGFADSGRRQGYYRDPAEDAVLLSRPIP